MALRFESMFFSPGAPTNVSCIFGNTTGTFVGHITSNDTAARSMFTARVMCLSHIDRPLGTSPTIRSGPIDCKALTEPLQALQPFSITLDGKTIEVRSREPYFAPLT